MSLIAVSFFAVRSDGYTLLIRTLCYYVADDFPSLIQPAPSLQDQRFDVYQLRYLNGTEYILKKLRVPGYSGEAPRVSPANWEAFTRTQARLYINPHDNVLSAGLPTPHFRRGVTLLYPVQSDQNVLSYLDHHGEGRFMATINVITQLAGALAHTHSLNIVHGRVCASSVLVDGEGLIFLCDVALHLLSSAHISEIFPETLEWMAPELWLTASAEATLPQCNQQSDVYMFGMMMVELLTGRRPFYQRRTETVVASYHLGRKLIDMLPRQLRNNPLWPVIEQCCLVNPSDRPTMVEVVDRLNGITASAA